LNAPIVHPLPVGNAVHDHPEFAHCGSAQSIRPLQSLSIPSLQISTSEQQLPFVQYCPELHAVMPLQLPVESHV
jgi:hypothetical protein